MAYRIVKKIPTGDELISKIPLSQAALDSILCNRQEIQNIIMGKDKRKIIIVGPCSAWPKEAVFDYAKRLLALNEEVKDKLKLVMRVYIQKPRTIKGWTGPVNQPNPLLPPDIEAGIYYARDTMVRVAEMGLPIADEALFTHNARGFLELLSWVAIGARSSEDQEHRIFASSIDFPVGLKNPTSGSIKIGVNGVIAAQHTHFAVFDGYEVETSGNAFAHLVLRGGSDGANYSEKHLLEAVQCLMAAQAKNPAIIVDVSHDNCIINGKKNYKAQSEIILNVVENLKQKPELAHMVKGFMLESFIKEGRQDAKPGEPIDMSGLSITDACLGWDETKDLILKVADIM